MALSYYSNWDSDLNFCDPELQSFSDTWNLDFLFDPTADNNLFLSEAVLPYDDNINSTSSTIAALPQDHKRQKMCHDFGQVYSDTTDQFINPTYFLPDQYLQFQDYPLPYEVFMPPPPPLPELTPRKEPGGGSLSAQSVAARQRRRKITEKTQELGKLVPGGHKMNTAEMLQAAYKYVKFLQAQVGVLGLMENAVESCEELQLLLESPLIQEKLYSSENCLVPQKLVEEVGRDDEMFKSNQRLMPFVMKKDH